MSSPWNLVLRISALPKGTGAYNLASNPGLPGNETAALPLSHRASECKFKFVSIRWFVQAKAPLIPSLLPPPPPLF